MEIKEFIQVRFGMLLKKGIRKGQYGTAYRHVTLKIFRNKFIYNLSLY